MRVVLIFLFVLLSLNAAVGRTSDLRQQLLECADKVGALGRKCSISIRAVLDR
jgi:hypothetical protein